jgi:uncharacterized PurR-regulated membrane protein YhhQ (DUF165 family)
VPYFIIAPVWVLCVGIGLIMLFFRRLRTMGYFVIAVPTGATLVSFVLSTSVFFLIPNVTTPYPQWTGAAILGGYLVALGLGALLGGAGAFLIVFRMVMRGRLPIAGTPWPRRGRLT